MRFGPSSYVIAKGQNKDIDLLAMETNGGDKDRPAWIVVRAQSQIRTLQDLKGKTFAFADERSTIGRFFVQAMLVRAGLREQVSQSALFDAKRFAGHLESAWWGMWREQAGRRHAELQGNRHRPLAHHQWCLPRSTTFWITSTPTSTPTPCLIG